MVTVVFENMIIGTIIDNLPTAPLATGAGDQHRPSGPLCDVIIIVGNPTNSFEEYRCFRGQTEIVFVQVPAGRDRIVEAKEGEEEDDDYGGYGIHGYELGVT
ncbi:hypothetical protein CJ030_MR8G028448 [Morella rubra]|uniref:Uncharacterized protein n=1 Tax=Morella rubra TaxID=262757 RepID=A0A6A1URS1_9ROSI|nr:hypothetical protein CJ030_MR8G028448 [Morella rubra]